LSYSAFLSNYAPDACQFLYQALIDLDRVVEGIAILPAMPVQSSGSWAEKSPRLNAVKAPSSRLLSG
jgi:hypothetical protein